MDPFFGRCGGEIHSSDVRSAFSGCQAGIARVAGAFAEAFNQTGSCGFFSFHTEFRSKLFWPVANVLDAFAGFSLLAIGS